MGRQAELQSLHHQLQGSEQVAITAVAGMGGIGKTALAQQYLRQYKSDYPGGRWYFKVRDQGLVAQLVGAAALFGWQLPDSLPNDRARVRWCFDRWRAVFPGRRLLLLDDVQTYSDVKPYLPTEDSSFQVLMTSRRRFGQPVSRLDLGVLKPDEALTLLTKLVDNPDRVQSQQTDATELCEWVGRLPLGIELIGRYLALHETLNFAKLQKRLDAKRLQVKAFHQVPEEMAYETTLQAAFELSWQDLANEVKTLAGTLSLFASDPIPGELITRALPDWDEEDLEDALDEVLVHRNLLQSDQDGSYQLHQLVREFVADKLETELAEQASALQKGVAQALGDVAKRIPQLVTVSLQQQLLATIPHMAQVTNHMSHVIDDSTDAIWPFVGLARFHTAQSLWPETQYWWQACLTMTEQRFGPEHPSTATSLNNLAGLYESMGRYSEAEPLYVRSLEISEAQVGPEHPDTATSLNNLAFLYVSLERYQQAEPLYVRSLKIKQVQLGNNHPSTARGLGNLAFLYELIGRYSDAESLYVQALEINFKVMGQEHPQTHNCIGSFANFLKKVVKANQSDQLSDHPLTRALLQDLS
ncbi:MAG: tetratricopeptide repeat protein [Cyanobacteria bacterium P01_A01_bin.114]